MKGKKKGGKMKRQFLPMFRAKGNHPNALANKEGHLHQQEAHSLAGYKSGDDQCIG